MQDGQNLFDPACAFMPGQDWRLDETAEGLIAAGAIEPLIIVGIDHAGVEPRQRVHADRDPRHGVGGRPRLYGRCWSTS